MPRTLAVLAAVLVVSCSSGPAPAPPAISIDLIPRDVLFDNPEKTTPEISPDGTMLAWLAPDAGVMNVWVRTLGSTDDRAVTADRKGGIDGYYWQQDSKHVLYFQYNAGDKNWHLYQTEIATKNTRDLATFEKSQARMFDSSPRVPGQLLIGINKRNPQLRDVHRLDLATGRLVVDTENPGDVAGWVADGDLRVRACQSFTTDGGAVIRVRDTVEAPWRDFQRWSADDSFGALVGFSGDGQKLRMTTSVNAETARLVEADLVTGEQRVIAEDPRYDARAVMTHPMTAKIEAVQFRRARNEWTVIDSSIKGDFAALARVRDGDFSVVSRDVADQTWIVAFVVDDAPETYYSWDRTARKPTLLFSNRPKLERYALSKMKPVTFPARDELKLEGYLTRPAGAPEGGLPLVLNVHGGPWGRDTWGLDNEVQWLASRGYAVLQVNFRGSMGYGKKHVNAGNREWGGKMHDDLIDAVNWAIDQGVADPKRVAIYGASYGGYSALVGAAFTPDVFACAVDIAGPSSIVTLMKRIPPYWKPLLNVFNRRVGNLETDEAFLHSRSPIAHVDAIRIPLLVVQGANDPRVKKAESEAIVDAVRKKGEDVEYLLFADEGHGLTRPENRMAYYAAAESFLAKHLGGRAQPPTDAEAKTLAVARK